MFHQFFAENEEEGVEHLIITCPVEREGSEPRILNWRDATPTAGVHGAAVTWLLLESMAEVVRWTDLEVAFVPMTIQRERRAAR